MSSFRRRGVAVGGRVPVRRAHTGSLANHPGVKPSIITSNPCTSTGSGDIDRVLAHQGLPLGSSLLIEEDGTTDFASTLVKVFLAQGVVHSRLGGGTHDIVIGVPREWALSLPGVYQGSAKEQKLKRLEETQKRMSVTNVIEQQSARGQELKIAWRYGLQQRQMGSNSVDVGTQHPNYVSQFDITSSLIPAANPTELTTIPLGNYSDMIKTVTSVVEQRYPTQLIRIALPLFLNPMIYDNIVPVEVIRFLRQLRAILKKHADRVVLVTSLSLDLYPRDTPFVNIIESALVDGVIELRPFDPKLHSYLERIYRKEPTKVKHGHLNVYKLPILSDLGQMRVSEMELSFKNGKKRFEVEQWSIPVDEEETKKEGLEF